MSAQNSTLRGLAFAFLGFAVFATHDALIKTLGGTYSVLQIIFFATLFSFVPMTVTMLADRVLRVAEGRVLGWGPPPPHLAVTVTGADVPGLLEVELGREDV